MKKRNTQNTMMVLMLGMVLALLSSCNSDFGSISDAPDGMGEIRIGPGGPAQSRTTVPDATELADMTYVVELTGGPGGPIGPAYFGPEGGTISLASGSWDITAKAYYKFSSDDRRLRGIAEENIEVTPGSLHTISMKSCIGVSTAADLAAVFDANSSLSTSYPWDTDPTHDGDLIVLESNITASLATTGILSVGEVAVGVPRRVTIIAEPGETRTLTTAAFTVENGASLTLGKDDETGTLVFDGYNLDYNSGYSSWPLYAHGGSLTIYGNTEIKNCKNTNGQGGAIVVHNGGSLTIYGGDIHYNQNTASVNSFGGAIYVEDSTFEMYGGAIFNNTANDSGGGVYITSSTSATGPATFAMGAGATISANRASANGGGVYAGFASGGYGLDFTMSGGTISGNTVDGGTGSTAMVYGGGLYLESANATLTGGSIEGNTVKGGGSSGGGGIYVSTGAFTLKNVSVSNNTAEHTTTARGGGLYSDRQGSTYTMGFGTVFADNTARATVSDGTGTAQGGGIYDTNNSGIDLTISDSLTVTGNAVIGDGTDTKGGGYYGLNFAAHLLSVTFSNNKKKVNDIDEAGSSDDYIGT